MDGRMPFIRESCQHNDKRRDEETAVYCCGIYIYPCERLFSSTPWFGGVLLVLECLHANCLRRGRQAQLGVRWTRACIAVKCNPFYRAHLLAHSLDVCTFHKKYAKLRRTFAHNRLARPKNTSAAECGCVQQDRPPH